MFLSSLTQHKSTSFLSRMPFAIFSVVDELLSSVRLLKTADSLCFRNVCEEDLDTVLND